MSKRRVVVTGLGIICPVGNDIASAWQSILAGVSGMAPITDFDVSGYATKFSAPVKDFDVTEYLTPKDARKMDMFIHYGIAAGVQAIADSGFEVTEQNADRIGVAIGSGIGGLPAIEKQCDILVSSGPRRVSPFFVPSSIINMISGNLSIRYGMQGPNFAIVTACTSGTHNIGDAGRLIEYGDADIMVAGGAEMATSPLGLAGFGAARALSTRNESPQTASRPWDVGRDGFVLGDGAGVLVLEEYQHAKKRGAKIYCELVGYGMSGDAFHMTLPAKNGAGAQRCMQLALKNAGLATDAVDYINAHGTSTPAGDIAEVLAVKSTFGDHAHSLVMSSTKSMTGHLLGAAGGIEAVFTVLAIRDQVAPPTTNIEELDTECDIEVAANEAHEMSISVAISNSFGFGGTNGTVVFKSV